MREDLAGIIDDLVMYGTDPQPSNDAYFCKLFGEYGLDRKSILKYFRREVLEDKNLMRRYVDAIEYYIGKLNKFKRKYPLVNLGFDFELPYSKQLKIIDGELLNIFSVWPVKECRSN